MAARRFNLGNRCGQACVRAHLAWWWLADAPESFGDDRSGATAIEYGLLAAGISVAIVGNVFALGPMVDIAFHTILDKISNAPVSG